jgi:hypothetical protein
LYAIIASLRVRKVVPSRLGDLVMCQRKLTGQESAYIDLSTARPFTVDGVFRQHPNSRPKPVTGMMDQALGITQEPKNTHPTGILAVTSTLPYFTLTFPRVVNLADCTGLMIDPMDELDTAAHCVTLSEVQVPSVVRFKLYPSVMAAVPSTSEVRVGTMYRVSSSTKELLELCVVHSNWPFLMMKCQLLWPDLKLAPHP